MGAHVIGHTPEGLPIYKGVVEGVSQVGMVGLGQFSVYFVGSTTEIKMGPAEKNIFQIMQNAVPSLALETNCPAEECECYYYHEKILYVISHLNDIHRWTREQIADWLETLDVDLTFGTTDGQV